MIIVGLWLCEVLMVPHKASLSKLWLRKSEEVSLLVPDPFENFVLAISHRTCESSVFIPI